MVTLQNLQIFLKNPVSLSNEAIEKSIASITHARLRNWDSRRDMVRQIINRDALLPTSALDAASKGASSHENSLIASKAPTSLVIEQ